MCECGHEVPVGIATFEESRDELFRRRPSVKEEYDKLSTEDTKAPTICPYCKDGNHHLCMTGFAGGCKCPDKKCPSNTATDFPGICLLCTALGHPDDCPHSCHTKAPTIAERMESQIGNALRKLADMPLKPAPTVQESKRIIDVCCGGRMFWFDKENPDVLFVDIRPPGEFTTGLGIHKRNRAIRPDKVMDFRALDVPDSSYSLVVFDPPHMVSVGENSFTAKTYGRLDKETWRDDLRKGFAECFRVLKPDGVLIFKWCEYDIPLREILALTPVKPLFGHPSGKQQKTHWVAFMNQP